LARVTEETITCFGCGASFKRPAVELDPRHDAALLKDESVIWALSVIKCPCCGYEETRPVQVTKTIEI
jgi:hypothetical protein